MTARSGSKAKAVAAKMSLGLGLSLSFALCGAAQAQTTISTLSAWNGSTAATTFGEPASIAADAYGQTFTVPAGVPLLTDFKLVLGYNYGNSLSFTAYLMAWDGEEATGPVLYQSSPLATDPTAQGLSTLDFPVNSVTLTPGSTYVFFVLAAPGSGGPATAAFAVTGDSTSYAGGNFVYTQTGGDTANLSQPWQQAGTVGTLGDSAFSATFAAPALVSPTITFSIPKKHDFDPPFSVAATSNSPGSFTYSPVSGPASVSGSTVTLSGTASVTIQASQAASGIYAAGSQDATFQVTKGSVFASITGGNLSEFDLAGVPFTGSTGYSGGGARGSISTMAYDGSGNLWMTTLSSGLSSFSDTGSPSFAAGPSGGGLDAPIAVAIDGANKIWVANGNNTVSEFSAFGAALSPAAGYSAGSIGQLTSLSVDISGNLWLSKATANEVVELLGIAKPVRPIAAATASGTPAAKP